MTKSFRILGPLLAFVIGLSTSTSGYAGSMFGTAVEVNNDAITNYEISQRVRFLKFTGQSGDLYKMARDGLIEDRLKMQAARQAGVQLTDGSIDKTMAEFASRANQTLPQFTRTLAAKGIDRETLRDFTVSAVTWRELVRLRFAGRGEATEAEIDRALAAAGPNGGLRVLLSEIILFAPPPEAARQKAVAERLSQIRSISQFSAQARALSVAQSKDNGGRMPWTNINNLPPVLRPLLSSLKPGEVTQPLAVENAFVLFQLRDIAETSVTPRKIQALEYAQITVPTKTVQNTLGQLDVCDDFYGLAKRTENPTLKIVTATPKDVPTDIAAQLAVLDSYETTMRPISQDHTQITMMCGRSFAANQNATREDVAASLRQRRLSTLANGYLADLRSSAKIIYR